MRPVRAWGHEKTVRLVPVRDPGSGIGRQAPAVEPAAVSKTYPGRVRALDEVTLTVSAHPSGSAHPARTGAGPHLTAEPEAPRAPAGCGRGPWSVTRPGCRAGLAVPRGIPRLRSGKQESPHILRPIARPPVIGSELEGPYGRFFFVLTCENLGLRSFAVKNNGHPSRTALMSAAARAAHLLVDDAPSIFVDTLAQTFLGERAEELLGYHRAYGSYPVLAGARSTAVTRSRYTEDRLSELIGRGLDQYVILGAGLDSFAYRSALADRIRVFEVDKPATQCWKRAVLSETDTKVPPSAVFVPVDFEKESADSLAGHLVRAGFDPARPALISWLGVTMYLTPEAIGQTLSVVSGFAPGTELIVEHLLPAGLRDAAGQSYAGLVMAAAAEQGEPWRTFLGIEEMDALLLGHGLRPVEYVRQRETVDASEWERTDALRPFELSVLARASVPSRRL